MARKNIETKYLGCKMVSWKKNFVKQNAGLCDIILCGKGHAMSVKRCEVEGTLGHRGTGNRHCDVQRSVTR